MDHPNIKSARVEVECNRDGSVKFALLVDTDLELDANRSGYDRAKVDSLLKAVQKYLKAKQD